MKQFLEKTWRVIKFFLTAVGILFFSALCVFAILFLSQLSKGEEKKVDQIKERLVDYKTSSDINVKTKIKLDTENGCLYWGPTLTPVISKDKMFDCDLTYVEEYKKEKEKK